MISERSDTTAANAATINKNFEGAELSDAPDGSGVTVRSVQEGSPAAQAGLRANDLIVGVGRMPTPNLKTLRDAAKNTDFLLLNLRRGPASVLLPLR